MKLLHTSDWHVGKAIRGASRADEHRAVLAEIAAVAEAEAVDLVIVAGDLFDTSTPSPESEEIVYQALLALARTGATVAVIAGNHDNARRLRAVAPLLRLGNVRLVTEPTRPDDGGVLDLRTGDGTAVRVAMLPFVSKRGIVRAADLMDAEAFENAQRYSDRLRLLIDALCAGFHEDAVNVLAAHAFVLGAETGGGERPAHLVDEYAVTAQSFPPTIGYGALGHLHRPQRVPAGPALHYCGSPLQLDFGEGEQTKQVNVVTIEPGRAGRRPAGAAARGTPAADARRHDRRAGRDRRRRRPVAAGRGARAAAGRAGRRRPPSCSGRASSTCAWTTPAPPTARRRRDHRGRSPQELFDEYLAGEGVVDERVRTLFGELLDEALTP